MWQKNFEELKAYQKTHGRCDVGRSDGNEFATLKRWVSAQRAEYKKGNLSAEKIKDLEDIGFEWTGKRGRKKKPKSEILMDQSDDESSI